MTTHRQLKHRLLRFIDKMLRLRRPVLPTTEDRRNVKDVVSTERSMKTLLWILMFISGSVIYGSYTVLVHLCQVGGKIPFSSSSMVLMIEISKIAISLLLFLPEVCREGLVLPSFKFCLPFAIPACLYCLNNNIAVHMQLHMDPATYQILSNLKIVTTAVLYKFIIKSVLSLSQWCALCLLTVAGIFDSFAGFQTDTGDRSGQFYLTLTGLLMMLAYCTVSGLAGVYTEYILKNQYETSLHLQNILLYTFGITLNGGVWLTNHLRQETSERKNLFEGYSTYTWIIIATQACNGLIMSAVMKHSSNIMRLFIISTAMIVTTLLSMVVPRGHFEDYYNLRPCSCWIVFAKHVFENDAQVLLIFKRRKKAYRVILFIVWSA
ncbi:hypothetical protein ScPMuIL_018977 [Solemya velum]